MAYFRTDRRSGGGGRRGRAGRGRDRRSVRREATERLAHL